MDDSKFKAVNTRAKIQWLQHLELTLLEQPDQQLSLTDPDARPTATSGRGTGMVATTCKRQSIPNII